MLSSALKFSEEGTVYKDACIPQLQDHYQAGSGVYMYIFCVEVMHTAYTCLM